MNIPTKHYITRVSRNSPARWKKIGFVMLPHELLFDESLPRPCLMVYWVLLAHQFQGKRYCAPSVPLIARESRYSRPTVTNAIRSLEEKGWIDVERFKGVPSRYYVKVKK